MPHQGCGCGDKDHRRLVSRRSQVEGADLRGGSAANLRQTTAIRAQTTAIRAQTTAIRAQTTAIRAQTTAIRAQTTAIRAQTTAIRAQTTAIRAQTTAIRAQTTAIRAQTTAIRAARVRQLAAGLAFQSRCENRSKSTTRQIALSSASTAQYAA